MSLEACRPSRPRRTPAALAALLALATPAPPAARAQAPDPHLLWRTVRTPHFDVHYHAPLDRLAQRAATAAEAALGVLTESTGFMSDERTHIVLSDLTDAANGSASVVPRPVIRIFAAAPDDLSTIGDYDDWLSTLVTHEEVHILHLGEVGGWPAVLNTIFGTRFAPNAVQPRWFIEGLATYFESRHSSGGRMRSSLFDMYLRMDALEHRLLRLDQMSSGPVRFPFGQIPYLYGSRFIGFIAAQYGEGALRRIGRIYGRQSVPFGLQRAFRRVTGEGLDALYARFLDSLRRRYGAQRDAAMARGLQTGDPLTEHSVVARSPRYLPDGRIVHYVSDGHSRQQLRIVGGGELSRATGETWIAPHPDGRHLVLSMPAPVRDIYTLHDLFLLDTHTGQMRRLTRGMRAQAPDVSPDGTHVAFVTQRNGTSHLEIAQLADIAGTRRRIVVSPDYGQIFTPRFSPDGNAIAFGRWRDGGYRDVAVLDLDSGTTRLLTEDRAQDRDPAWSRDGQSVYFCSDRTGISNIYRHDLATDAQHQITNVLGGAFQPDVSPDGKTLVYLDYRSHGFGLASLPLAGRVDLAAASYVDARPAPTTLPASPGYPVEVYRPYRSILARSYWLQWQPGARGPELTVQLSGGDVLAFHNYAVSAGAVVQTGDPIARASYEYGRWALSPGFSLFHNITRRADLYVGGRRRNWLARNTGGSFGLHYTIPGLYDAQTLSFSYALRRTERARPFGGGLDPNDPPPALPALGWWPSAALGWSWTNLVRNAFDVSPSSGYRLSLGVTAIDPIMGRDTHWARASFSARRFWTLPWSRHHVLAMRYGAGIGGGDARTEARFYLGGYPQVAPTEVLYDLLTLGADTSFGGVAMRGFPPAHRVGDTLQLLQTEYRFPLWWVEHGVSTLPVYLRRFDALLFADVGDAFDRSLVLRQLAVGSGAELFAHLVMAYSFSMSVRLGVARGLTDGGATQFYMTLGTPFQ